MEQNNFLPPELSLIFKNVLNRLYGLVLILLGLILFYHLLKYPDNQNLLNYATTAPTKVGLKIFSYFSDIFIYFFGVLPTFLIFGIFTRFGYQILLKKESNTNFDIRFLSIFLGMFLLSINLGLLFSSSASGGLLGNIFFSDINYATSGLFAKLLGIVLLIPSSYFIILSLDFTYVQIFNYSKFVVFRIYKFINFIKCKCLVTRNVYDVRNDIEKSKKIEEKDSKKDKISEKKQTVTKNSNTTVKINTEIKTKKSNNSDFILPPLSFLDAGNNQKNVITKYHKQTAELLETCLSQFGILGEIKKINPGPVITLYEFEPAPGIKVSSILARTVDITRALRTENSVRISTIPSSPNIGIEIPNLDRQTVYFQGLVADNLYQNSKYTIPLALGQDIGGENVYADLAKMPHLLVAGRTGAGKSVFMLTIIMSILYKFSPDLCKLILIDPKKVEFANWKDIPHLLTPVVTDATKAVNTLKWAVQEMENRYSKMEKIGVNNLKDYNKKVTEMRAKGEIKMEHVKVGIDVETGEIQYEDRQMDLSNMPLIVIIIDEVADLMMLSKKEVEACVQRITQLARAAGIHLIMATQRPSVDVITGVIKSNLPTRISFQTTSDFDSKTILGRSGAENLLDKGDMLYISSEIKNPVRIQGPWISPKEAEDVANWLRKQGTASYQMDVLNGGVSDDSNSNSSNSNLNKLLGINSKDDQNEDLYKQAVSVVIEKNQPSISYIQRCLHIGYNKAATFIERMEKEGIVSEPGSTGKRTILKK